LPNISEGCEVMSLNIENLHIGMKVNHPRYGVGVVKALTEQTADISFDDAPRTLDPASADLASAEPTATLRELQVPLANLIRDTAASVVEALGLEKKDVVVEGLATRWQRGSLVLQPADTSLQPKEVALEIFFHKIVMIRNNLRVLEQKVNASEKLSDADKFDLQQYITRCYGSLTTFNILFKDKEDQFSTTN
jgi:enoyl-[acyl-carrier-protein] reductase (NADH)